MCAEATKNIKSGFSAIEVLVVLVIIGMLAALSYPSVVNSLETRNLESTARDISNEMQRAKFQAVKTMLNHRLRFLYQSGRWVYVVEREDAAGIWNHVDGIVEKIVPSGFNITVNLPSLQVMFSPLGMVSNFNTNQNNVVVQSSKLAGYNQPSSRYVYVFSGGSIYYRETALNLAGGL